MRFQLVVTVAVLLSGCIGGWGDTPRLGPATAPFAPAEPLGHSDAAGDENGFAVTTLTYGPSCRKGCIALPQPVPDASGPSPAFDILRVGLESEREEAFTLHLELSFLEATFAWLDAGATHRVAEYYVCWEPPGNDTTRCALLLAAPSKHGAVLLSTFHLFGAEACGGWKECAWDVPVEVTYGAPAGIRFTVPKDYADWDGNAPGVRNLRAETRWFSANKAAPLWHLAWTVRAPGEHDHDHAGLPEVAGVADRTSASTEMRALTPGTARRPVDPTVPVMRPGPGNLFGAGGIRDHAELDIVQLDMHETESDLVVQFRMAQLDAMPSYDLQIALLAELDTGHDWEVGVMQSMGTSYGYAGRCVSFGCHHAFLERTPLKVVDDAYETRVPLTTLGNPAPGSRTTWFFLYTMYGEANLDVGPGGADGSVNVHSGSLVDSHVGGRPFEFAGHLEAPDPAHDH